MTLGTRFWFVAVAFLASTWESPASAFSPPDTTESFVGQGQTFAIKHVLAHRFLLEGSVELRRRGRLLERITDYRLDVDAGTFVLASPLAEGEEIRVTYSWVPIELPVEFSDLIEAEPTPQDSSRMVTNQPESAADRIARTVDQNLVIGGAKTFSIEGGSNRDAAVEQSLRVSVSGSIGDDVKVTALLSDQNIPLQPEGNTQRLEELDEILIRIESNRAQAVLGDFVTKRTGFAFGALERRLSGAQVELNGRGFTGRGVGASSRGDFRSVEIPGEEGKQGPYLIGGAGPGSPVVIVAGSERVWVDGALQTRGERNDYVIDYSRGEVEFTNRRLISQESLIAIDFETAEQPYRRNFYLGEGTFQNESGDLSLGVAIVSESDSDDPEGLTLTEERRQFLIDAGDTVALVPGAVCGLDDGDYLEVDDHFEYVGGDSGTCDVSFTFVGAGLGDYVRDRNLDTGITFFRFTGSGLGDYTPGLLLTAPQRTNLADVTLRAKWDDRLSLEADGAVSQLDRNTLSSIDDDDNEGAAGRVSLNWTQPDALLDGAKLELESSIRREERDFSPLGRTRDAYLGEVWNFTDSLATDETVGDVRLNWTLPTHLRASAAWGRFDRSGRFESTRREVGATYTGRRLAKASFRSARVEREDEADSLGTVLGDLARDQAELTLAWKGWRPGVTYWRDDRNDERAGALVGGRNETEWGTQLAFEPSREWKATAQFKHLTADRVAEGAFARESVARTWEVRAEANPRRSLRGKLSWIRRELDFEEWTGELDRDTNLTRADLTHESFGSLLIGEYTYETTSRFATDVLASPESLPEPTLAVDASARIRIGAWRRVRRQEDAPDGFWYSLARKLRSETLLRVEEETSDPDRGAIYRLDFSRFQNDEFTVFGKTLVREEITLFPDASAFTATLRVERIDTEDNRADPARVEIVTNRRVLRARNRVGPRFTLETQATWQSDRRSDSALDEVEFQTRFIELREELVWQRSSRTRLTSRVSFVDDREEQQGAHVQGVALGAAANATIAKNGQVRADLTWTHPTFQEGPDLGSRLRTRTRDELRWQANFSLRLSDKINASLSYSGRSVDESPTIHLARAEARALF